MQEEAAMRPAFLGRPSFILALVVIALVAVDAPATAAIHPGDYVVKQRDIPVAGTDPGFGGGSVRCGKGRRVVTGGAFWHRAGDGPDATLDANIASSAPMPNGRRWFAAGINHEPEELTFTIVAYCLSADAVGTYGVRKTVVTFFDNDVRARNQRCGPGRRVVTGGAFWHHPGGPPDPGVLGYLRSSTPDPDGKGWYAVGDGRETELRLTIIALCLPIGSIGPYRLRTLDVPNAHGDPSGDAVSCGAGKRAVPGGAYWHRPGEGRDASFSAWLKASVPRNAGRRWYADGWNDDSEALLLRIVALCLPA
jgi:hypothetical protein